MLSNYYQLIANAFAGILFISNSWVRALILISLLLNLNAMFSSIVAFIVLIIFIQIASLDKSLLENSYFIYNSLLVGIAVGNIFELSFNTIFFIGVSSILTFLLTICLNKLLSVHQLPILSIPFSLISCCIYLAAGKYANLFSLDYYQRDPLPFITSSLPTWLSAFFCNLGAIFFMPYAICGIIIFIAIIAYSRILAFQAVSSFYIGIFIHSILVNSVQHSLATPYSFNYILVGMALGGTFMIATHKTIFINLIALSICVLLIDMTSSFVTLYHIPVFTIPFNITVILFIMGMKLLHYPDNNTQPQKTPESSLLYHSVLTEHFKMKELTLSLPLSAKSHILQGFNGQWTHKGDWKHAYDFVQINESCSMFKTDGMKLTDYYIYGKEILSPATGYVVSCKDDLPDNKPGIIDSVNNWGNYIIIKVTESSYVEISHLQTNSLQVKPGDYIYWGQPIAQCGSNGYSLFPHLHIQAQSSGYLGAKTIPFNFSIYQQTNHIKFFSKPEKGDTIQPISIDNDLYQQWFLPPEGVVKLEVRQNNETRNSIVKVVRETDIYGKTYLSDSKGSKLYFSQNFGSFYFYDFVGDESSSLKQLYLGLPHIPLCHGDTYSWQVSVPASLPCSGLKAHMQPLLYLLNIRKNITGTWLFNRKENKITGTIKLTKKIIHTSVTLNSGSWKHISIEIRQDTIKCNNHLTTKPNNLEVQYERSY